MKKLLSVLLCAVILLSLVVPAMATSSSVVFTTNSRFLEGCTVTVDKTKTMAKIQQNGTTEQYNGFYNGYVKYFWYRDGWIVNQTDSITFTSEDVGKRYFVRVAIYTDATLSKSCGYFESEHMIIKAVGTPVLHLTSDSSCTVGSTMKVDKTKTMDSIIDCGSNDVYNAYLDGRVQYYWLRDGEYHADGMSYTVTADDKGHSLQCVGYLFRDVDHVNQFASLKGPVQTAEAAKIPIPQITTKALTDGALGQSYYQKLECTNPDVTYSLFRSSLPAGLTLTQHGEIEGTPTKAGLFYVVIMVKDELGQENTAEFELTITDGPLNTIEITQLPKKLTYTAGEKLDMTGLRVRVYTPEGYLDLKDGNGLTYSDKALVTLGEQKIKLTYKDAMEIFIVTVVAAPDAPSDPTTAPTAPTTPTAPTAPTDPGTGTTDATEDAVNPTKTDKQRTKRDKKTDDENTDDAELLLIIAIVAAGLLLIAAIIIIVIVITKKRRQQKQTA